MTTPEELSPLLACLKVLQKVLDRFEGQGMVFGGVAASLLGKPRLTADVDAVLLLSDDQLPALVQAALEEGLTGRIPDAEAFAKRHRVLLLHHAESDINVDVTLGMLPFEKEAVERSVLHHTEALAIRIPTPEDLIIFKAVAHRPKDLEDIRSLVETNPGLDTQRIEFWLRQFADVMENPAIWDDVAALL